MRETAYLLQAALICAWWVGLATDSRFFAAFQFNGISPTSFWAFLIPDIALLATLSTVRAYYKNSAIEFMILGAFGYATLYCFNAMILTSSGCLPTGLMTLGLLYNVFLCFNESMFRNARSGLLWNTCKTLVQIVCIWTITLGIVPLVILGAFEADLYPLFGTQTILGAALFLCFSALGLTSACFMVREGDGTPLPLDQTNRLVVSGPYRFVRNPMAIAGIGQGVAIAIIFQSTPILVYSILGALVWHLAVRPVEEQNMLDRFGEPYQSYRQSVSCWLPTFRNSVREK